MFESSYKVLLETVLRGLVRIVPMEPCRPSDGVCATRPMARWSTCCSPGRACAPRHVLIYLCKQHPPTTGPPTSLQIPHWHIYHSVCRKQPPRLFEQIWPYRYPGVGLPLGTLVHRQDSFVLCAEAEKGSEVSLLDSFMITEACTVAE